MSTTYVMGRTDRERRRLLLQGSILNPLTERFLRGAGLAPGMHVLDLGCGIGDVALAAAQIIGPGGHVVGIDVDEQSLEVARQRARDANLPSVRFERADLTEYRPTQLFDAVVARHVLLHTADPLDAITKTKSFLHWGGIAAFQEFDLSFWPAGYPEVPLVRDLQRAIVELFARTSRHANVGMELFHLMQRAGFRSLHTSAECLIDGGPDSPFYEWFAETVRSVLPGMERFGLAGAVGDVDILTDRLRRETVAAQACFTSPLIVGVYARAL